MDEEINVIYIKAQESGERIDALLARSIDELSRNSAQKLIETGSVIVNNTTVKKNYRCSGDEIIEVFLPELSDSPLIPQNIPLEIEYEDSDLLVVNKPRGMVVHPAPGHPDSTLVNALLYHCGDSLSGIGGERRPGIVHRIDMDTSGLLIVAKNDFSHAALSAQLADRSLSREYEAIVHGNFKELEGTINKPIGRNPKDRKKMAITDKNSKRAVTHWSVIEQYKGFSHIRCRLETGRTHQIRVHMASIGHILLGDYLYGATAPEKGLYGQCLHAKKLKFIHPRTNEKIKIEIELPEYFKETLTKLGEKIGDSL